ncbi:hypothetical protein FRC11_001129, partial [Ceratobasidium sp. 423]
MVRVFSHAKGHKVDFRLNGGLSNYITANFKRISNRGDGSPQYESPEGNIYV